MRIQFPFEMELIPLFYKMHYKIRPGLGLQCMIVVFPDHTHLFFWSIICTVEKEEKCTTADTENVEETVFFVFVFISCL